MSEYNQYVTVINKIFEILSKMKTGWNSLDNLNYIETIEEYKETVINAATYFKSNNAPQNNSISDNSVLEELGE